MTVPDKQRIVTKILTQLARSYPSTVPPELSVLDHLLIAVIQEGTSFRRALDTYQQVLASFHDLNELRVSHPLEVEERLDGIPDKQSKARRILDILQFVFETTYSFDLESMKRKPLKQAQRQLSKITGTNLFVVAATVQRSLGGHAMPIDEAMGAILARLRLVADGEELERVRTGMEHIVPKSKGQIFCLLVSELVADDQGRDQVLAGLLPSGRRGARGLTGKVRRPAPRTPSDKPGTSRKAKND